MDPVTEVVDKKSLRKNVPRRAATAWRRLVSYMFEPEDGECLAALRIVFGLLMMIDTMDERGFCQADKRWMEPMKCYFPLFDFIKPLPGRLICLAYGAMFTGVLGILIGFHYRISCAIYAIPYWYLFLADKSLWNNHSYLFGLLIMIFSTTNAHHNWSMDRLLGKIPLDTPSSVPRWNYMLLRIQFFIMYFVAGLKKFEPDWLLGYSMMSLGHHYAFTPFRYFFSAEFVDHWIVHVGGFLIDLLSGFGLCFQSVRPFTIVVLLAFHGMNATMFTIGMFPYVCAAMIPVFCEPATMSKMLRTAVECIWNDKSGLKSVDYKPPTRTKQNAIVAGVCVYTALQLFLPYSHVLTQGYNGWRNGLYGYSWDMMVYNVDVAKVEVKVLDHVRREQFFLDPHSWTNNNKWMLHGDMLKQFAGCVAANMADRHDNISVLMDIWGSLNGRFHQRLVDPNVDLLHAPWSPWSPVPWLLPLIRHLDWWRPVMVDAKRNTDDDLLFFADFPGMTVTNDVEDREATTTTLAVLEGAVAVRGSMIGAGDDDGTVRLVSGEAMDVTGRHVVTTVSATPSCYMFVSKMNSSGGGSEGVVGGCGGGGNSGDDDGGVSTRPAAVGLNRRGGCSKACYAFTFHAVRDAFSALFFRTTV
ncbi:vitamin K-dependent gamma-carboxylase [Aphis gossypii]|uniref:vitamin K-dependent gamma-carboxylase n=1 Tax=Aphis gossypii TaxID=80765 RepID=UPI002158B9BC|nr:vitamin K-dependent gamma-carboxylase [Aphis gossypii]